MIDENIKELFAKIEAVFFAVGEPVSIEKLAEALDIPVQTARSALDLYKAELENEKRGVTIVFMNDSVQMATKSDYHDIIAKIMMSKASRMLSQSALEVLTIIAYNQPVTKAAIDSIRGVDSYNSLCRLSERELIEERGRMNTIGHPKLYGTTDEFLRMFGLVTLDDLPRAEGETLKNIGKENEMTIFDTVTDEEDSDPEVPDYMEE